ncbi:hypothetical protein ACFV20_06985 [Streptomyces sp. NPDC059696]|uniref:hypothetical protein n=1 Tax=Streptomyces sp. NPDC059696 TaxID=3346911 RepID=UPI0036B3AB39
MLLRARSSARRSSTRFSSLVVFPGSLRRGQPLTKYVDVRRLAQGMVEGQKAEMQLTTDMLEAPGAKA